MNDVIVDGSLRPGSPEEAAVAFARIERDLWALDEAELATINVDIPRAVVTVLSALPALQRLRPRIVEELPRFPMSSLDKLQTYALGTWYAHLLTLPPAEPDNKTKPLFEEGAVLRENLLVAAEALAHRKLLEPKHVAQIRSGRGHVDLANDLVALATLFTNNWGTIEGKTAVTPEEVERAAMLGPELLIALGIREQARERSPAQLANQRRRAFTLLVRAYDDCRRAVSYLRWREGDTAKLVPSLYAKRTKTQAKTAPTTSTTVDEAPDSAPEMPPPEGDCAS